MGLKWLMNGTGTLSDLILVTIALHYPAAWFLWSLLDLYTAHFTQSFTREWASFILRFLSTFDFHQSNRYSLSISNQKGGCSLFQNHSLSCHPSQVINPKCLKELYKQLATSFSMLMSTIDCTALKWNQTEACCSMTQSGYQRVSIAAMIQYNTGHSNQISISQMKSSKYFNSNITDFSLTCFGFHGVVATVSLVKLSKYIDSEIAVSSLTSFVFPQMTNYKTAWIHIDCLKKMEYK